MLNIKAIASYHPVKDAATPDAGRAKEFEKIGKSRSAGHDLPFPRR